MPGMRLALQLRPGRASLRALAIALAVTFASVAGAAEPPDVEVIQSVPVETEKDIAHPDLRLAKDVWVELVRGARETIDLAHFYVSSDPAGGGPLEPVLAELEK